MIESISYEWMLEDLKSKYRQRKPFGILVANPNTPFVRENILNVIDEYHIASSQDIDFYFPGYGAYWNDRDYPDAKDVCVIDRVRWSFSTTAFMDFISQLETNCVWEYNGEAVLLILEFRNGSINFDGALVLDLDKMIKDKTISSTGALFHNIFRHFRRGGSVGAVGAAMGFTQFTKSVLDVVKSSIPYHGGLLIDNVAHFVPKQIEHRKNRPPYNERPATRYIELHRPEK